MSEKKYPIGGYAPGNYQCHCATCGGGFIGDKRAYQCEPCALNDKEKFDALSPDEQGELMKRNAELIKAAFKDLGKGPAINHDRVIANQVAGMPLEEAIFQDGYSAGVELEKKRAQSVSVPPLIPGAPTETGTYFAVIKCYVSDEPQMCVLHYRAHKNLYRAVGHAFNIEVKAEDIVGYVGEQGQHGAVWVKCSDRLPGWKKRVKWRDGNNYSYATDGEISFFEMEKPNLEGWEWLDESGQSPAGLRETIEDIILSAGKHNQEQCSEIADAILSDLLIGLRYQRKDESPAAGREEDAVEFAEWAGWDWRRVEGKSMWENQKTLEILSTSKLHEKYKTETGR